MKSASSCYKITFYDDIRLLQTMSIVLTLRMLGQVPADDILKYFYCFSRKTGFWRFMQIVSIGDNLHEMSNPVVLYFETENEKNIIDLSSSEIGNSVVKN